MEIQGKILAIIMTEILMNMINNIYVLPIPQRMLCKQYYILSLEGRLDYQLCHMWQKTKCCKGKVV